MTSATATTRGGTATDRARRRRARIVRRYHDSGGAARELIARPAAAGSLLLVDRAPSGGDERLVAHLAPDEPSQNAAIAATVYLEAEPARRRCRALEAADELRSPLEPLEAPGAAPHHGGPLFRLRLTPSGMSIPALRWACPDADGPAPGWIPVSLRAVIEATERYEPFCELTRRALERHSGDPGVSSTVLRAEYGRVLGSPIVLNRALREAVVDRVAGGSVSMSEIAMRCGRCKRDSRGRTTGETSWLARRVGLLPEGGHAEPTRWVHSDVLALIARDGLGVAPREVELG